MWYSSIGHSLSPPGTVNLLQYYQPDQWGYYDSLQRDMSLIWALICSNRHSTSGTNKAQCFQVSIEVRKVFKVILRRIKWFRLRTVCDRYGGIFGFLSSGIWWYQCWSSFADQSLKERYFVVVNSWHDVNAPKNIWFYRISINRN